MCAFLRRVVFFCALALSGCQSIPDEKEFDRKILDQIRAAIREEASWIEGETGYKLTPLPVIVLDKNLKLGWGAVYTSTWNKKKETCTPVLLRFPHGWRNSLRDRLSVVHDIVHHGQCLSNSRRSWCEKELEAYQIQNKWALKNRQQLVRGAFLKRAVINPATGKPCPDGFWKKNLTSLGSSW